MVEKFMVSIQTGLLITLMTIMCGCGTYGNARHPVLSYADIAWFTPKVIGYDVELRWETKAEEGCLGFNVLRRMRNGVEVQINNEPVLPLGIRNEMGGAVYGFIDPSIEIGKIDSYTLVEINRHKLQRHDEMTKTVAGCSRK